MRRVLLIGCSGSGRTTVGAVVAQRAGWPFLDDDALLERTTGVDVRTLYVRDGAEAVAQAGLATLNLLLGVPGPLVVSVTSGVLLDDAGSGRLRAAGHVVWLKASASTLARRVGRAEDRPWLLPDPAGALRRHVADRNPLYEQVADQVVDTDVLPVSQVARAVLEGLPEDLRATS